MSKLLSLLLITLAFIGPAIAQSETDGQNNESPQFTDWALYSDYFYGNNYEVSEETKKKYSYIMEMTARDFSSATFSEANGNMTIRLLDGRSVTQKTSDFWSSLKAGTYRFGSNQDFYTDKEYSTFVQKLQSTGLLKQWTNSSGDDPDEEFYCLMVRQTLPSPRANSEASTPTIAHIENNLHKLLIYSDIVKIPLEKLTCKGHSIQEELTSQAKFTVDFWEKEINASDEMKAKYNFDRRVFQTEIDQAQALALKLLADPSSLRNKPNSPYVTSKNIPKKVAADELQISVDKKTPCKADTLINFFTRDIRLYEKYPALKSLYHVDFEGCRAKIYITHPKKPFTPAEKQRLRDLESPIRAAEFLKSLGVL